MRRYGADWNCSAWLGELDASGLLAQIKCAVEAELGAAPKPQKKQSADEIFGGVEKILNSWRCENGG